MTPQEFVPHIAEIAKEAGGILMSHFLKVQIEYKGEADVVTEADRQSETRIVKRLRERFPGHDIVGEEGQYPQTGSDYRWYVDPLDGTTNFAHGLPIFCVSIGLEHKGQLIAGMVYDPTRDEMFYAAKGSGAFLNKKSISVSTVRDLPEALAATGFPSKKRHKNPNIHFYQQITLRTHGVRRCGSAAIDLAYTASGRFDVYWEFNLNPWDTAAGVLLVEEAGGKVTRFDGSPFRISSEETLASNALLHDATLKTMDDIMHGRELEPLPSLADFLKARGR